MSADLIIDLVRHMKARNREKWGEDDDARPLSRLGQRQAQAHAAAMAAGETIVAVYSSPALRCRQTAQPLADLLGLEVRVEPLLAETRLFALLPAGAENPLLARLGKEHPEGGRIVACSHGDTIPAFVKSLDAAPTAPVPATLEGFGGWYRVRASGDSIEVEQFEAPDGFPRD